MTGALELNTSTPSRRNCSRYWNAGAAMAIPNAFASSLRAITHPSLLLNTTTGLPARRG